MTTTIWLWGTVPVQPSCWAGSCSTAGRLMWVWLWARLDTRRLHHNSEVLIMLHHGHSDRNILVEAVHVQTYTMNQKSSFTILSLECFSLFDLCFVWSASVAPGIRSCLWLDTSGLFTYQSGQSLFLNFTIMSWELLRHNSCTFLFWRCCFSLNTSICLSLREQLEISLPWPLTFSWTTMSFWCQRLSCKSWHSWHSWPFSLQSQNNFF